MTRAVARVTTTALAVLAAALLSLALFAGPASAAEEAHGDETTSAGVKGSATGFVYTAIAGVAMGVLVFSMSNPGDIHRADAHHDGHGGPKGDQQMAT